MTETAAVKRAKAKVSKAEPTEYVVLEQTEVAFTEGDPAEIPVWIEVARLTAVGSEANLLRKWAAEQKRTGTFKLVPARSWKGGIRLFEQTSMASEPIA